ncbi:sugar phosphate nucleotidyltransferase [Fodinicurvata halophila]|uniref:sugar phosphate nucleotidyltransferase n=1 Tax=Fodinicurvata halophila TaxID=1419723 RepID=UPI0036336E70
MTRGDSLNVVVLAAGLGTRMRSSRPKVLHEVAGLPMVHHVLKAAEALSPKRVVVVIGPDMPEVEQAVAPWPVAIQQERLGTADAVKAAASVLQDVKDGDELLILYGDGPLITPETLQGLQQRRQETGADFVWLGFRPPSPTGYGRLLLAENGEVEAIVEEKDATEDQRRIDLCWAGYLLGDAGRLLAFLGQIDNRNAKESTT